MHKQSIRPVINSSKKAKFDANWISQCRNAQAVIESPIKPGGIVLVTLKTFSPREVIINKTAKESGLVWLLSSWVRAKTI